jgi:predicted transcriptional regulator
MAQSVTKIELDADTEERVQRLASSQHRSAPGLMKEAIEQYVEREEQRQQLRQDASASLKDYRETGLHLTGEEVDAWLARLEAGEDIEPPECHR